MITKKTKINNNLIRKSMQKNYFSRNGVYEIIKSVLFFVFQEDEQKRMNSSSPVRPTLLLCKLPVKSSKMLFAFLMVLGLSLVGSTAGYSQIAQRGTATSANNTTTSLTITKPTGVVTGDIMIVNIAQKGSNTLSNPTSAGWTLIDGQDLAGSTDRWGAVLYKIAVAGEPANYTFTLDAQANGSVGSIVAFSGVNGATPFDVASGTISVQPSQTGVVATTKTTVTANAAVIMFGMAANGSPTWSGWSTTSPGALTELYDNQNAGNATVGAAWAIKPAAGATGNGAATLSAGERNGGILIVLRPSAPAPTITSLGATNGCTGTSLTITGTNLSGATAATIGGTAASITGNTATTVTVTVGAGTTGQVTVTTSGGTANSGATNFTVNALPANPGNPTSNSPQCNPTGVTITRAGSPPGGVTWYWQTVTGGTSTANNSTSPLVVNTTGTYYIRAYNGTCWSSGEGSVAVTVNALPVITTQPSTPAAMCSGSGSASLSVVASSVTTYQWQLNGANISNGAIYGGVTTANLSITNPLVANAGTYTVVLNSATCPVTSNPVTLTVNALPANPGNPTSNSPQCNPTGVTITRAGTPPGGVTWYWQTVTGGTSTANNSTSPLVVNTTGTYYIRAYNGSCWSTGEGSIAVTVNALPVITTQPSTPAALCSGSGSASLSVVASSVTTYQWQLNGANISNGAIYGGVTTANLSITNPLVANAGTYTVVLNSATCPVTSSPVTLTVNALPANPGNPTSNSPQCNPTGVTITRAGTPPGGVTWYWQTATGGTSTANNSTTPLVVNTTGTYYIRAYNGSCWSTGEGSVAVTVNNPISTLATVPNPSTAATGVCYSGSSAITSVSWTAAAGATSYDVYFGTVASPPFMTNQAGVTYNTGALSANTTYYWKIVPRNNASCGASSGTPVTWSFTTNTGTCHCTPSSTTSGSYISGVASIGTLNDVSNAPTGLTTGGYGDYSSITIAKQIPGGGINTNLNIVGSNFVRTYVDWNNDGDFADAGENVYTSGAAAGDISYGFIVPVAQTPGNYIMRIRTRSDSSTIDPCATGYATGETEDYTINIVADCAAKITSVTNGASCGTGSTVALSATAAAGTTEFRWYAAETGGAPLATTATGSWTTGALAATTIYYVTAYNGTCESWSRTAIKATINPTTNITISPTTPIFCGDTDILTISATGDFTVEDLFVDDFESGLGGLTVSTPTNTNGGADSAWSVKTSTYSPNGTAVWRPAINSGSIGNKFAFTTSDYASQNLETILTTTASINATNYIDLTLTFKHYYSDYGSDTATVQVSTDGGATWTNTVVTFNSDLGSASKFTNASLDLTPWAGQSNLKIRFRYAAGWADGWAIDDIRLYGTRPLNTTFTWGAGTVDAYTDFACTIPYVNQSLTTIYVKPNATQLATTTWSFTVSATLGNGCVASKPVTVTNNTKTWVGTTSNWSTPSNWSPAGVPTAVNCVVVPNITNSPIISGSGYNALAKNLTVKSTGNLQLQSNNNITVTDWVNVNTNGVFSIKNNASLVQVNPVANTGIVNIERITKPMYRYDYTYWNSPVTMASNFTIGNLSPLSTTKYKWTPSVSGGNGNWASVAATVVMNPSVGYIVRAPNNYSTNPATKIPYTANFIGTPNNGTILAPIKKGTNANMGSSVGGAIITNADDEWNLIGNPYPSGIDATKFLNLPANVPVIDGTIYIWTHNSSPTTATPDPFYGDFVYNYTAADYAVFNTTGATATAAAATGGAAPTGYIASGQSFFVRAAAAMPNGATLNATFDNSMRDINMNFDFFRNANAVTTETNPAPSPVEKHRIWLNLTNASGGAFSQALIGYVAGATQELDRNFDGESFGGNIVTLYSLAQQTKLSIQGRALPFNNGDLVPLGYKATAAGQYSFRIDHVDGLFTDQEIYLEDRVLNVIYDIKHSPYAFTTAIGEFNDRFVLRYTHTMLGNDDFDYVNGVKVFANSNINVISETESIKEVIVYDILGKTLIDKKKIGQTEIIIHEIAPTRDVLIVKVILDNDKVVIKKVIY